MVRWWLAGLALGAALLLSSCHGGPHLALTVNTTSDGPDALPGDGVCEMTTGLGDCSLRAAIDEVNGQSAEIIGDVTIPAGTYVLTGTPNDDVNASGDLDVRRWINLTGTGRVVIDGNGVDRVIDVRPGGTLVTDNLTLTGGSVTGDGGAARFEGNAGLFANTTVEGNTATGGGGGLYGGAAGQLYLFNATVSGNVAALGGGVASGSSVRAMSSTVTDNVGGGLHSTGVTTLRASIVGDQQSGDDCGGSDPVSEGYNLDSDGTCGLSATGDRPGLSPELRPLAANGHTTDTHLPRIGSPALDTIPGAFFGCSAALDQREVSRPRGYSCDIGAAEVQVGEQLTVETVLTTPRAWDLAFTPDGTMLYTLRSGPVMAFDGTTSTQLADPADVVAVGEGGMLGIAVDPDFETNRRIYTCFNTDLGPVPEIRVVRWTVDATYTSLSDRVDIVTGIPANPGTQPGRHSGCRTRFGPDGYLWVTTGDAAAYPLHPQDPNSLGGKVLRVDSDGTPAPDNPGAPLRDEIYTYGHRNPQGISFRPSDGTAFSIEHGTQCDDEVNLLQPGANYGWNPARADGLPGYSGDNPMTDLVEFPDAIEAVWSAGCPALAPSGGTFVTGAEWQGLDDALIVAHLNGVHLRAFRFEPGSAEIVSNTVPLTGQGRLRVAVQGPDGALYVIRDADPGPILRVTPVTD